MSSSDFATLALGLTTGCSALKDRVFRGDISQAELALQVNEIIDNNILPICDDETKETISIIRALDEAIEKAINQKKINQDASQA